MWLTLGDGESSRLLPALVALAALIVAGGLASVRDGAPDAPVAEEAAAERAP